ncbi:MAG: DUF1501 domain-containing protein [Acidobacteriota bacterium]
MSKTKDSHHDAAGRGCPEYLNLSRRRFLGLGAGAVTAAALPAWLPRVAYADTHASRDVVVSIFLRGGADALTLCVPFLEDNYYRLRPTQAIPRPDSGAPNRALSLDGRFGIPQAMAPLMEAYGAGHLAMVHACGQPKANRSHFDAMHVVEVGHGEPPGSLATGWLGRHLQQSAPTHSDGVLRALALGFGLPRTLVGAPDTLPVNDPVNFDFRGRVETADARQATLEAMYADLERPLGAAARNTFRTLSLLRQLDVTNYQPAGGGAYPEDPFGQALRSAAALIRADAGIEAIAIDIGGWDTHERQGSTDGELNALMASFAGGLAAFHADLQSAGRDDVTTVALSEFGRNVFENASGGTDHGHGGVLFALGQNVQGGRVLTDWPGLEDELLYEGQDLKITIDYRDVLSELLEHRLGAADAGAIFDDPGYVAQSRGLFAPRV